jgi:hypothetical protein
VGTDLANLGRSFLEGMNKSAARTERGWLGVVIASSNVIVVGFCCKVVIGRLISKDEEFFRAERRRIGALRDTKGDLWGATGHPRLSAAWASLFFFI